MQSLLQNLGVSAEIEVHADSAAAIGICRRSGIGRVRHLAVGQLWVHENLRDKAFRLFKVAGAENPADLLTKHQPASVILEHSSRMNLWREGGRASTAPLVAARVTPWLGYASPPPRDSSVPPRPPARPVRALTSALCAATGPLPSPAGAGELSAHDEGARGRGVGVGTVTVFQVPPHCPDGRI